MKPTHYYNIRVRKALRCFLAFFMLIGISVSLSCLVSSCGNSKATDKQEQEEDLQAKNTEKAVARTGTKAVAKTTEKAVARTGTKAVAKTTEKAVSVPTDKAVTATGG